MSKNITIAEGKNAKRFTNVAKLRTDLIDGGSQNWIPEDEAIQRALDSGDVILKDDARDYVLENGLITFTELSVFENGVYRAKDSRADGFSSVDVDVSGGDIPTPGGREVKGIASDNLSKAQSVKVVRGGQELTKLNNNTYDGWLRNSDNLVYQLKDNKYNGYNVTTGILESAGTDTVYRAEILGGGEAVALWLTNSTTPAKCKILWMDGTFCEIEFEYADYNGVNTVIGANNGIIAVYHGLKDRIDRMNATVDIFNKTGDLITSQLALMIHGWSGLTERSVSLIVPISNTKVACWYMTGNANLYYRNGIIDGGGLHTNPNGYEFTRYRYIGQYGGFYYIGIKESSDQEFTLHRINFEDIENAPQPVSSDVPMTVYSPNYYGHCQVAIDGKYYLYNINDLTPVYDSLENSKSNSLLESDKYLVFGATYQKSSGDVIISTNQYPEQHSDDTVLGIMKEDCNGGSEGTVIVLFT